MAINTVNARYEGFIFDGENSRTYGVYVTDVKVFGTPVRNVEMVTIPGRNGAFSLDNGNFDNIEVKYTCAMSADTPADFNDAISDLRNMLASRIGYKRLEDEINTSEYRMAVYKGGLEVPTMNKQTGTFDVVFDCKPQRFLKSGETAVSVADGGTITNPTLFDARPMLEVYGYGDININGETVSILSKPIGTVKLNEGSWRKFDIDAQHRYDFGFLYNGASFNPGDTITVKGNIIDYVMIKSDSVDGSISASVTSTSGDPRITFDVDPNTDEFGITSSYSLMCYQSEITLSHGTAADIVASGTFSITGTIGGTSKTATVYLTYRVIYNGTDAFAFIESHQISDPNGVLTTGGANYGNYANLGMPDVYGESTQTTLGSPLYFDLDIGEAYKIEGGGVVSVNGAVSFPAELPTLKPGANTITYDNTVTNFKIVPRWWKV